MIPVIIKTYRPHIPDFGKFHICICNIVIYNEFFISKQLQNRTNVRRVDIYIGDLYVVRAPKWNICITFIPC